MLRACDAASSASWWWSRARARSGWGAARGRSYWPRCCATPGRTARRRGSLVDLVWGDAPPTAATMVHGAVARLRRELPSGLIGTMGGGYVVDAPVDAVEFETLQAWSAPAATVARTSTAALALWRGPAYAGIGRPFARDEAARLEELRRRCVERLADACFALGRPNRVVAELSELVAAEPTRERAAAQLMLALHAADRQADALAVYRRVRATLVEERGVEPGPALRAAEARVLGGPGDLRKHEAPHRSAGDAARLPAAISSFVGRAHDLARVGALLRAHPLTTLTGPGGIGKTRLAIEVARRAAADAVFVDLARTAAPFETTLAEAFGIRFDAGDLVDVVAAALADKLTVVVLDNCEHLLDPCATFAAGLLAGAPNLRVLATSRERLGVPGEQVHPVAPLPLPRPHAGWAEIRTSPAVRLFTDRAAATRPGFMVTAENAGVVVEICRRLDGLPLAVELAAARTSALPLRALADRLDDGVLAGRAATARHRSLAATVAWSHDLLPGAERALFPQLGVFAGDFDLDAVAAIAGGDPALPLAHLVECSLVQAEDGRFRLLSTTRAFATAATTAAELCDLRRSHAHHYRDLARRALPYLHRAGSGRWLADLHRERDNLRAALEWAAGPDGEPQVLVEARRKPLALLGRARLPRRGAAVADGGAGDGRAGSPGTDDAAVRGGAAAPGPRRVRRDRGARGRAAQARRARGRSPVGGRRVGAARDGRVGARVVRPGPAAVRGRRRRLAGGRRRVARGDG